MPSIWLLGGAPAFRGRIMTCEHKLRALAEPWSDPEAAERANGQLYLTELAGALGVQRPGPRG